MIKAIQDMRSAHVMATNGTTKRAYVVAMQRGLERLAGLQRWSEQLHTQAEVTNRTSWWNSEQLDAAKLGAVVDAANAEAAAIAAIVRHQKAIPQHIIAVSLGDSAPPGGPSRQRVSCCGDGRLVVVLAIG